MMRSCFFSVLLGVLVFSCSIYSQTTFERWYGYDDDDIGWSVAQTTDGGYIIAGETWSSAADLYNVYLIKTDSIGDTIWIRTFGGNDEDYGRAVAQPSDGGYIVTGQTNSYGANGDVYLIKTDSYGDTSWTMRYGGPEIDWGYSVAQTTDGGYIVAGYTWSYGVGLFDFYLIRTDSIGDTLWTGTYGGADDDRAYSVAQTTDGGYIVAGWTRSFGDSGDVYLIKADSIGDTLWTRTYGGINADGGYSVATTSDAGFIIAGATQSFGAGSYDVYLIKTDSLGDTLWTKAHGDAFVNIGRSVAQTADGGYIVAGRTFSSGAGWEVYLIKTDVNGDTSWTRKYGDINTDEGYSVAPCSDGGYVVTGYSEFYSAGGKEVYLIKTDSLGNVAGIKEQTGARPKTRDIRLTIQPNPFTTGTSVKLLGGSLKHPTELKIYDVSGRLVLSHLLATGPSHLGTDLKAGIYFLKLNGKLVGKAVKVR